MGRSCAIVGCDRSTGKLALRSFFSIPAIIRGQGEQTMKLSAERRHLWLRAINRKNFTPSPYTRVCSNHFLEGKPAKLYQKSHPDWVPTLKLNGTFSKRADPAKLERYLRLQRRNWEKRKSLEVSSTVKPAENVPAEVVEHFPDQTAPAEIFPEGGVIVLEEREITSDPLDNFPETQWVAHDGNQTVDDVFQLDCCADLKRQLDECRANCAQLQGQLLHSTGELARQQQILQQLIFDNQGLQRELATAKEKIARLSINEGTFRGKDKMVNFYTGLPTADLLFSLHEQIKDQVSKRKEPYNNMLSFFQQFVMVLMRFRLNMPLNDLAYRFDVHQGTVSKTVRKVTEVLFEKLVPAPLHRPSKKEVQKLAANVQRKYNILNGPFVDEIQESLSKNDPDIAEKIFHVCCALFNLTTPSIPPSPVSSSV